MPEKEHIPLTVPLEALAPITLEEMDGVKLLNRIDSKYLTDEATLVAILSDAAAAGYRVLETGGARISPYDSVYFDTPGLRMFLDHHNRRLRRQKVRTRAYLNSGDAFLEIKKKTNKGRTRKKRTGIPMALRDGDTARQIVFSVLLRSATTRLAVSGLSPRSLHSTEA